MQRRYRKGSVLFVQGETGERCFVIVSGTVKISAYHPDGREAVLAVLGPGDVFGELALFGQCRAFGRRDGARGRRAALIDAQSLNDGDRRAPGDRRSRCCMCSASGCVSRTKPSRTSRSSTSPAASPGRLADLADAHGVEAAEGTLIDIALSQESLAQMVGATRESVNKALALLKRRGLVARTGKRYIVSDVSKLRAKAR